MTPIGLKFHQIPPLFFFICYFQSPPSALKIWEVFNEISNQWGLGVFSQNLKGGE